MNKTVEAIKNGQNVGIEELFEVLNLYELTHCYLVNGEETVTAMQVNRFEDYGDVCELSQTATFDANKIVIKKDEIGSFETDWNTSVNSLFVTFHMKNGMDLKMFVLYPGEVFKATSSEDFCETDIYEMKEFLDDVLHGKEKWNVMFARITDMFGFDLKMQNVHSVYVDELPDQWKLHINDEINSLVVPVIDDSFYTNETEKTKEILVKPLGQPFMEIKLLLSKK